MADERYCLPLPDRNDDAHTAPLLCAGLIGYRAYRLAGGSGPMRLGLYGFGAAAHLIAQLAVAQGQQVYAFVRGGDAQSERCARQLGAVWAGTSEALPPAELDAALIFAPVGALLCGERTVRSVANLTRADGEAFFDCLARQPVATHVQIWPLAQANEAIAALRAARVDGAAVLLP